MEPIIKIRNLNFTYNKNKDNEFQALINVSLDIYPEDFVIVFGPSGCGKSTLLNVVAGLEKPDNGELEVFHKNLMEMSKNEFAMFHRNEVGMIYQSYNLISSLTVLDNVSLPQVFINVGKRKREKQALSLLDKFGILKQAGKIPTELSGGEQQRIGIARAIINNPQIVLADEPVGNLDSVSAENVLNILSELNKQEKKTIILVTHNPENLYIGDRVIYMKDGIVTREVVNQSKHEGGIPGKKSVSSKLPVEELQDLVRVYHGLSPEQINILIMPYKAKIFTHHFITTKSMEETKVFEEAIQRNLLGTISNEEFLDILRRSSKEGGIGFDTRTAERIARRISRVLRISYFVYQAKHQKKDEKGRYLEITGEERARRVAKYLLNSCYAEYVENLSASQLDRMQNAVEERLSSAIQKHEFYDFLDKPFADGGVGLNVKTARAITEELELILILGFGVVQMKKNSFSTISRSAVGSEAGEEKEKTKEVDKSEFEEKAEEIKQKVLEKDKENNLISQEDSVPKQDSGGQAEPKETEEDFLTVENFIKMLKQAKEDVEKLMTIAEVDKAIGAVEFNIDNANEGNWDSIAVKNFGVSRLEKELNIGEKSEVVHILIDTLNLLKYKKKQINDLLC
ncbi:MAG: ATP-binding cassette domain-containing protein [bacterium]